MIKIVCLINLILISIIVFLSIIFNIIELIEKIRDFIHFKKKKGCYVIRRIHKDNNGKFKYMSYVSYISENGVGGNGLKNALIFKNAQDALTAVCKNKFCNEFVVIEI